MDTKRNFLIQDKSKGLAVSEVNFQSCPEDRHVKESVWKMLPCTEVRSTIIIIVYAHWYNYSLRLRGCGG